MDEDLTAQLRIIVAKAGQTLAEVRANQTELAAMVAEVRAQKGMRGGVVSMVYVPIPRGMGHVLIAMDDGTLWLRHADAAHWDDLTQKDWWYQVALPKDDADEE